MGSLSYLYSAYLDGELQLVRVQNSWTSNKKKLCTTWLEEQRKTERNWEENPKEVSQSVSEPQVLYLNTVQNTVDS